MLPLIPEGADLRTNLQACRRRGWKWLVEENIHHFAPPDLTKYAAAKRVIDLALLYGLTRRWCGHESWLQLGRVGEFLNSVIYAPSFLLCARLSPTFYNPHVLAYLAFRATGHRIAEYEYLLKRMRQAGSATMTETLPSRALEVRYYLWKSGLRRHKVTWGQISSATTLGKCKTPVWLSDYDVYTLSHDIFFLTDFSGPAVPIPVAAREKVVSIVEALAVHYWRIGNLDILGELLLNLIALDQGGSSLFKACAASLLRAWRPDGILPGPDMRDDADQKGVFLRCYHTVVVGILLCNAYLFRKDG